MSIRNTRQYLARLKLGNKVEMAAKPIALVIDKITGTNIQNCNSCRKRKEYLNNLTNKDHGKS